jgi:hypothetical protein
MPAEPTERFRPFACLLRPPHAPALVSVAPNPRRVPPWSAVAWCAAARVTRGGRAYDVAAPGPDPEGATLRLQSTVRVLDLVDGWEDAVLPRDLDPQEPTR